MKSSAPIAVDISNTDDQSMRVHEALVKEVQQYLRDLTGKPAGEEKWIESNPANIGKLSELSKENSSDQPLT